MKNYFQKKIYKIQELTIFDNNLIIKIIKNIDENYEKNVKDILTLYYKDFMRNY